MRILGYRLDRELVNLFGAEDAFEVVQVDSRGRDGSILVRARTRTSDDWWRRDEAGWHACLPENDAALPLSALLRDVGGASRTQVLSYRPAKRLVILQEDDRGSRILKGYRPRRFAQARRRHEWAHSALGVGPLRAPTMCASVEARAALVFEAHPGERPTLDAESADLFFRVGVGLRRLQEQDLPECDDVHDASAELQLIDKLSESVAAIGVARPDGWGEARARLVAPAPDAARLLDRLAPAHRDLHDGQLLVGAPMVLLDFDLLCRADPFLDAGNLIAHLRLRQLQGLFGADADGVDACGHALLEGLDREGDSGVRERLRFYQASCFLRLALVYGVRQRWARLGPALVSEAARCIDDE